MRKGFGVNCNGRIICGAGWDALDNELNNVFEFRNDNFVEIKPLTTERVHGSSLYIPPVLENHEGLLLVAGHIHGKNTMEYLDTFTMEYLMINNDFKNNHWRVCDDKLPCSVGDHQMNLLRNKLILTGCDFFYGTTSNEVWQGTVSFNQQLRVNWSPLPAMIEDRFGHVAIVIQEKLFCIGGRNNKSTKKCLFPSFISSQFTTAIYSGT
jgi:hypothetical protein